MNLSADPLLVIAIIVGITVFLLVVLLILAVTKNEKLEVDDEVSELDKIISRNPPSETEKISAAEYDKDDLAVSKSAEEPMANTVKPIIYASNTNQTSSVLKDIKTWFKDIFSLKNTLADSRDGVDATAREAVDFVKRIGNEMSVMPKTIAHSISVPKNNTPKKLPKLDFWSTVHNLNIINFWRIVLRWWYWVILGLIAAYAGVYVFNSFQPQIYKADAKIMIVQPVISENGNLNPYIADQTALSVAKTINQITTTENFQDQVMQNASGEYGYVDQTSLRKNIKNTSFKSLALGRNQLITGENVKATSVIMLSAVADDAGSARILADSAGNVLANQVKTYFSNYNSDLIDIEPALLEEQPVYPQKSRNITIILILAIAFELILIYGIADARLHHLKNV
ncbi:MAG: hypothetical protein CEN91_339 [Candidatus Berkelbacteria bacterium Licking1014_85]|uniref:Polysaccharide chain length determinant N-terminal domain-containing protein n=1 Tax=Candidatus Berkelbacteria bacterium Licking1014_85 TaxID=2017148 RepID=A0A554LJ56_9BACT|nr:MAG: hypothetical protein CEN91_339 [Candidatus Berkelbacteria bacterium Licking1014_85]